MKRRHSRHKTHKKKHAFRKKLKKRCKQKKTQHKRHHYRRSFRKPRVQHGGSIFRNIMPNSILNAFDTVIGMGDIAYNRVIGKPSHIQSYPSPADQQF